MMLGGQLLIWAPGSAGTSGPALCYPYACTQVRQFLRVSTANVFEALTDRLQAAFRQLSSRGKLTPRDVRDGLKDVRLALLEADVHYQVVKDFIKQVQNEALGEDILKGLNPTQQIVNIVHEQLVHLLGDSAVAIDYAPDPPTVIILCGLQGSGKTTTAGKLALSLKNEGRSPLLCATDVYRPAAIEQLQQIGEQVDVPVFSTGGNDPVGIARAAVSHAESANLDPVIIDTAGRLHIDQEMMAEIEQIEGSFDQPETLLVLDALTGQDAVNVAEEFGKRLELDGLILTKLDGDARGGAALSARAVTGVPIKLVGVGEKMEALDVFHPDRMAQRILGMGDVLSLIEKAQQTLNAEEAAQLQQRLLSAQFDLEDFRTHLGRVRGMGPLDQILKMIPGTAGLSDLSDIEIDERELDVVDTVINSMTPAERQNPELLNASRKRRIAHGSGTSVQDVNIVLKQHRQLAEMMKAMTQGKGIQLGRAQLGGV